MCVCVWWWCLAQWAGEQSIQKTPLQHQLIHQLSPLAAVTQVYPALCCSQHTSRANINISKLSVNSPLCISLSRLILASLLHSLFPFSLSLLFAVSLCLSSRENIIVMERGMTTMKRLQITLIVSAGPGGWGEG